jgi:hypothetical protein
MFKYMFFPPAKWVYGMCKTHDIGFKVEKYGFKRAFSREAAFRQKRATPYTVKINRAPFKPNET